MAEAWGEGGLWGCVGPVLEVGGEHGGVVLGVAVVVVVGDVSAFDGDDGGALGPGFGEGFADVGPGAFDGGGLGGQEVLLERGLALVFEDEMVLVGCVDESGVDDAVAGVEEDLCGREGAEVLGGGGEDAVVEAVVSGVVAGEAAGDGGGPEDEPAVLGEVVVEGWGPDVEGGGLVGHDGEMLVRGPVDEVGGGGVADDGGGAPGPGPDHVEGSVGAALDEGVAHEFIGFGLVEYGLALVGEGPVVAVG